MIGPHATPAAAHAALGEFLTEDAPALMSVQIHKRYEGDIQTYTAEIHVHLPQFDAWLDRHGFTAADVVRGQWGKERPTDEVVSVTSNTGVRIFALDLHHIGGAA